MTAPALLAALLCAPSWAIPRADADRNAQIERVTGSLAAQNWVTQQAQPTEEQVAAAAEFLSDQEQQKLAESKTPRRLPAAPASPDDALEAARLAEAAVGAAPAAFAAPAPKAAPVYTAAAQTAPAAARPIAAAVPSPGETALTSPPLSKPALAGGLKGFDQPRGRVTIGDLDEPVDPNAGMFDNKGGGAPKAPAKKQGFAESMRPTPVD